MSHLCRPYSMVNIYIYTSVYKGLKVLCIYTYSLIYVYVWFQNVTDNIMLYLLHKKLHGYAHQYGQNGKAKQNCVKYYIFKRHYIRIWMNRYVTIQVDSW